MSDPIHPDCTITESPMMFLRISLLLSLLCCWFPVLRATEYRVSNVAQISALLASLKPGDVMIMENKVWTDANIIFQATGTEAQPITLRADTPGQVFLEGTSNLRIAGRWVVVDGLVFRNGYSPSGGVIEFRNGSANEASDSRLTNTAIVDHNPPLQSTDNKWISLYGFRNRVDNCYLKGKTNVGTTLVVWLPTVSNPNYHLIERNYFGFRQSSPDNGHETIRIGDSNTSFNNSRTTVQYNYFEECNGEIEAISNKSCENTYRYNTFFKTQGTLTLRHGNRCIVEGNFFFGEGVSNTGGIRIIGEDHVVVNNYIIGIRGSGFRSAISIVNGVPNSALNQYFQVKQAIVAFNSLIDNSYNFDIGTVAAGATLPPLDCIIANNLVRGYSQPHIKYSTTPVNITYEGNLFWGTSLGISPQPAGITTDIDPKLQSVNGLWRPTAESPLIGGAQGSYPSVIDDMDGQARTDPKDIGADQYSTAPITRRPLTRNDVGPLWMRTPTSVAIESDNIPTRFVLEQNFPNPFNSSTAIPFTLGERSAVTLEVFNIVGQRVALLLQGEMGPGTQRVEWLADVPSGIYFYRLYSGVVDLDARLSTQVKTMVHLK